MTNLEKYNQAFITSFMVNPEELPELTYQATSSWDSVGHMSLMASLEETFGISLDTDDIIDFSSYEKGKEIIKKYHVLL